MAIKAVLSLPQVISDRFIIDHIKPASLICTDANPNYDHLPEFSGYCHEVCNHGMFHFGPTNRIVNVWSRLLQFIRKVYHHVWKEHLPELLKEFQARINSLKSSIHRYHSSLMCYKSVRLTINLNNKINHRTRKRLRRDFSKLRPKS